MTHQILALLISERDKLNRAIEALGSPVKRRGRPPKNPFGVTSTAAPAPVTAAPAVKKRTFSAAQRAEQATRMKAYWAKKRKAAK